MRWDEDEDEEERDSGIAKTEWKKSAEKRGQTVKKWTANNEDSANDKLQADKKATSD